MTKAVDALERAFAALLAEARANPALAAALADALAEGATPAPAASRPKRAPRGFDPVAAYRKDGGGAVRARLAGMRRADILALVKGLDLDPCGVLAFSKARLIEHVVSAARRRAKTRKSPLDY